jgi:hypothetical protein
MCRELEVLNVVVRSREQVLQCQAALGFHRSDAWCLIVRRGVNGRGMDARV